VPAYLIVSPAYTNPRILKSTVGLSQFIRICSVVLFLWSGDLFRQTRYLRASWLKAPAALGVWFVLAPLAFGTQAVLAPGFAINAILLVGAATMYAAVLLERRMLGAGLVALVLLGLAMTNLPWRWPCRARSTVPPRRSSSSTSCCRFSRRSAFTCSSSRT